jgi:VWFA-related protein
LAATLREKKFMRTLFIIAGLVFLMSAGVQPQERLRVVIEEVRLPVAAFDKYGHFDPSLTIDDLLVLENGIPQEVRSVRHVPANVVLLLDTGGELNTAKSVRITREIAKNLVSALNSQDQVSVFQFSDKVELLQDWTRDFKRVSDVLDTRLLSGKRARLSDGLIASVSKFGELPVGSCHLVLITDGVEIGGGKVDRIEALKRVAASSVIVHVISYTTVSREATQNGRRIFRKRDKSTVPDEVVNTLPRDTGYEHLRRLHKPGGMTADIDPERQRRVREYQRAMTESEAQLRLLSDESGGHMWLPESFDEMIADGAATARLIDSEYVLTYKPKLPVANAPAGEVRRLEVMSRRIGLTVISRRHYVAVSKREGSL